MKAEIGGTHPQVQLMPWQPFRKLNFLRWRGERKEDEPSALLAVAPYRSTSLIRWMLLSSPPPPPHPQLHTRLCKKKVIAISFRLNKDRLKKKRRDPVAVNRFYKQNPMATRGNLGQLQHVVTGLKRSPAPKTAKQWQRHYSRAEGGQGGGGAPNCSAGCCSNTDERK